MIRLSDKKQNTIRENCSCDDDDNNGDDDNGDTGIIDLQSISRFLF